MWLQAPSMAYNPNCFQQLSSGMGEVLQFTMFQYAIAFYKIYLHDFSKIAPARKIGSYGFQLFYLFKVLPKATQVLPNQIMH